MFGRRSKVKPEFVRSVVLTTIRNHPPECMFAPNTVEEIVSGAPKYATDSEMIDYIACEMGKREIYCPHEGIDRRLEFGIVIEQHIA